MTKTAQRGGSEHRWLIAALAIASFYGALALRLAFRLPDLVQDDARQHVFWMQRFRDPTLFPNDLIADYFQAVAPAGYKALYWIFAKLGVDPLLFAKLLPVIIGFATAYFAFRLFVELWPSGRGAFLASVLLSQLIWFQDDVISATPRGFVYPLFLAFLFFLIRKQLFLCLLALALEGLVYPQSAFVSAGVLIFRLLQWNERRLQFSRDRLDYIFCATGFLVVAVALALFANSISRYGPVIGRHEAVSLPEFLRHGRSEFFVGGFGYWFNHVRSGLFPDAIPLHVAGLAIAAVFLPLCSEKFHRLQRIRNGPFFFQMALAATSMWTVAHIFLFKLHLPARYSQWVFRILIAFLAAMMLAAIWDAADRWREDLRNNHRLGFARFVSALLLLIGAFVIAFPHLTKNFPSHSYAQARPKALYDFLRTRPKACVVATMKKPGSMIPVFAQRSIFVTSEHAIPYHQGYYQIIRQRGQDLVRAHVTSRPDELLSFIEQNHIDLIIITPAPFTARYLRHFRWFGEIAPVREIAQQLEQGEQPALSALVERCKIWENKTTVVLDAHLITQTIRSNEASSP